MTVKVNEKPWPKPPVDAGDEVSYEQVVKFAFPDLDLRKTAGVTVLYDDAIGPQGSLISGDLYEGQRVKIGENTNFTVDPAEET